MKHGLANGPANISAILMIITGGITYVACTYITAPYGRHVEKKGWGVMVPARLSWFFMESPNLWIPLYHYSKGHFYSFSRAKWILLGLFLIHYIHRSILYPLFRVNGKYHQPLPISVPLLAFGYCSWNAVQQVLSLTSDQNYPNEWLFDPRFLIGITLFCLGFTINVLSDSTLLSLKANKEKKSLKVTIHPMTSSLLDHLQSPGNKESATKLDEEQAKTSYDIPYGGLFEYVSCANYFGEIVEWTGFAIACWSLPAYAFALFTFCNLGPRALKHHRWYKETFKDYPRKRFAMIPFFY